MINPRRWLATLLSTLCLATACAALEAWPAETNALATKLTGVDAELNVINTSGAFWNPQTRTLWIANNSGRFFALVENGAGSFRMATNAGGTRAVWAPGGDLESLCQANYGDPLVYLMDENGYIREYDVSNYGVVAQNRSWDIRAQCAPVGGAGPEALEFVPDDWLRREGFRNANGALYTSVNGMGGLFFVGHQSGGYVHVFDMNRVNNTYVYVGRFKTGRAETAGLDFDRTTGKLSLWHNTGSNYLEVCELNSFIEGADRRLRQIVEYTGPRTGNLEGLAIVPTPTAENWCFITDDDNTGGEALTWYRTYQPSEDVDADLAPDGWELYHFASTTTTTGAADTDQDGMSNTDEFVADTDPNNAGSFFLPPGVSTTLAGNRVTIATSALGRSYTIEHKTSLLDVDWTVDTSTAGTGSPLTFDLPRPGGTQVFYRARVTLP